MKVYTAVKMGMEHYEEDKVVGVFSSEAEAMKHGDWCEEFELDEI